MIGYKNWATVLVKANSNLIFHTALTTSWTMAKLSTSNEVNTQPSDADDLDLWLYRFVPALLDPRIAAKASEQLFYGLGLDIQKSDDPAFLQCPSDCIPRGILFQIADIIVAGQSVSAIQTSLAQFLAARPDIAADRNQLNQFNGIVAHIGAGPLQLPVAALFSCGSAPTKSSR